MFAQLVTGRYHSHLLIKSVFYHLTLNKAFEREQAPTDFIVGSLSITKLRHLILNCTLNETKENKKHPTAEESIIPNRCQSLGIQQSQKSCYAAWFPAQTNSSTVSMRRNKE